MIIAIIGASRGLGLSLLTRVLADGHEAVATIRTPNSAIAELRETYGEKIRVCHADITDEAQMRSAAERWGHLHFDAVVVTAGVIQDSDRERSLLEADIADLRRTLDVNGVGPVIAAKHWAPRVRDGGRFFIVTSEGVDLRSCGTWIPAYGLSKTLSTKIAGILNASDSRIDYFAVHPGRMNTAMGRTTAQIEPEESAEGFARLLYGDVALKREDWYIDYQGAVLPR